VLQCYCSVRLVTVLQSRGNGLSGVHADESLALPMEALNAADHVKASWVMAAVSQEADGIPLCSGLLMWASMARGLGYQVLGLKKALAGPGCDDSSSVFSQYCSYSVAS